MSAKLAILGNPPAFEAPLHVGGPNLGDRTALLARINDILDRRWLSNDGPLVQQFERRIADYVGVKHCIATCNATVALEIAIRALELNGELFCRPTLLSLRRQCSLPRRAISCSRCAITSHL